MWYETFLTHGIIPESLIRLFLKLFYEIRFRRVPKDVNEVQHHLTEFISKLNQEPIAISTDQANEQHYELPTAFFKLILGKYMKYSCGYWNLPLKRECFEEQLTESEERMLKLTCERAKINNGDNILDLGCGWGSLSTFIKDNYEDTRITAVSNSSTQKQYIQSIIRTRDIEDLNVITANIADLELDKDFDVIISVEMFEHMRNYKKLLKKLGGFLKPNGRLFIHIFTDKNYPYFFEMDSKRSWMTKYFFRGGIMPSSNLLLYFQDDFLIEHLWKVSGIHYKYTLNSWLWKMKANRCKIQSILAETYGKKHCRKWWNYWKLFFISLAEVFGSKDGNQRFISHYLFKKR
jgi:cyclopropane-fatty-acyl-phospholipid synthase